MSEREKFSAKELVIVTSNYDLGAVRAIKEFPKGSRKAPKLLIAAEKGEFLLKRRARGKDDPFKVAFSHAIQLYLATKKFPLPLLMGTRKDNNSMYQYNGCVYEMFTYIRGNPYDNSVEETFQAGRAMGLYHQLLRDFETQFRPAIGSYHDARNLQTGFSRLPKAIARAERAHALNENVMHATMDFLRGAYQEALEQVNAGGLNEWRLQIVHCDWHPGNLLFRSQKVVAVLDFDSARLQQRIIDVANGALQFSILGGTDDTATWPDFLDQERFAAFLKGYAEIEMITPEERRIIPGLMIEAMVAESVFPIAATGFFGRIDGFGFLQMIERKVRWLQKHQEELVGAAR